VYVSDYSGNCARGRLSEGPIRIQKASGTDKTPEYLILSFVHALPCLSANSEKTFILQHLQRSIGFPVGRSWRVFLADNASCALGRNATLRLNARDDAWIMPWFVELVALINSCPKWSAVRKFARK
jgi:hypothetical protein